MALGVEHPLVSAEINAWSLNRKQSAISCHRLPSVAIGCHRFALHIWHWDGAAPLEDARRSHGFLSVFLRFLYGLLSDFFKSFDSYLIVSSFLFHCRERKVGERNRKERKRIFSPWELHWCQWETRRVDTWCRFSPILCPSIADSKLIRLMLMPLLLLLLLLSLDSESCLDFSLSIYQFDLIYDYQRKWYPHHVNISISIQLIYKTHFGYSVILLSY